MKHFTKIVNGLKRLIIFAKSFDRALCTPLIFPSLIFVGKKLIQGFFTKHLWTASPAGWHLKLNENSIFHHEKYFWSWMDPSTQNIIKITSGALCSFFQISDNDFRNKTKSFLVLCTIKFQKICHIFLVLLLLTSEVYLPPW